MIRLILVYQILKYCGGGSQDSGLDLLDQLVQIGEEWLLQIALSTQGRVTKWVKYPTGYYADAIFTFSFIIETTSKKVLQVLMPLQPIFNKNFCFNKQIFYYEHFQIVSHN